MTTLSQLKCLNLELDEIDDLKVINSFSDRERFSKDFFDYSPVLKKQLEGCCADVVVRPISIEAVIAVARACNRNNIPLTLRGAGTGNYGQCVPLNAGVVMLMGDLKSVRSFDAHSGAVTVESGCLLRDLNSYLIAHNRQLRLLPSTWRSASVGGFISGGSGGIGSVRWGFLRDPGHLLALEIVTVDDNPRKLQIEAKDAEALNHAYGTNGIITALTLSTAPLVQWQQVAIDGECWSEIVALLQKITHTATDLFLCSLLEKDIVNSLPEWSGKVTGGHRLLILVSPDGLTTLKRLAISAGMSFTHIGPEKESSGSGLRELSWNHTTLHMRAIDPEWTYLQMLLPHPEIEFMKLLKSRWGNDLLWHLESVRQQGVQRLAALPLVRWKGETLLQQLINECKAEGAIIFNPHVITVEDGGLGVVDVDQVEAKRRYDPKGILNPGKLRGWLG